jgi:acyl-coenzyme A synthetase/AMP-(fatty) acid ligase
MGDVGYLDDRDRFWFCGRKGHRIVMADRVLFTIPCESIFNTHPAIYRSALVGPVIGDVPVPVLVAEPWPESWPSSRAARKQLLRELGELAARHESTRSIQHFLLRRKLPVDTRHNSKIFREQLRPWAARRAQ